MDIVKGVVIKGINSISTLKEVGSVVKSIALTFLLAKLQYLKVFYLSLPILMLLYI